MHRSLLLMVAAALLSGIAGPVSLASRWQQGRASLLSPRLGALWSRAESAAPATSCSAEHDEQRSFAVQRMTGDGRCLFRALAQGDHQLRHGAHLPQVQETAHADDIRSQICDRLVETREFMQHFIDEDFDTYVRRMRQPHTWGGEPELSVSPHVLGRPVAVFDTSAQPISQYEPEDEGAQKEPAVSLLFHGAGHYDLLVPAAQQQQSKL